MIIDDIRAAKIGVQKISDNHYEARLKKPKACPKCKHALVSKGARTRSIYDIDSDGTCVNISISYPRYYCSQCKNFVSIEAFDKIMPPSKYTDTVKNALLRDIVSDPTKPYSQICNAYGVSKSTADTWLREAKEDLQNERCRFEPTETLVICPFTYGPADYFLFMGVNNNKSRILVIDDSDILEGAIYHYLELITRIWPMPRSILVGDHTLIPAVEDAVIGIAIHRAASQLLSTKTLNLENLTPYANAKASVILSKQALYNLAYTYISKFNATNHWYSKAQVDDMAREAAQQINSCRDMDPYTVLYNLSQCSTRMNKEVWSSQERIYHEMMDLNEYMLPHDIDEDSYQKIIDEMAGMYSRGISFDRAVYMILRNERVDKMIE